MENLEFKKLQWEFPMLFKIQNIRFSDLIKSGQLLSYEQSLTIIDEVINQEQFQLIKSLIGKLRDEHSLRMKLTNLEGSLVSRTIYRKSLSKLYKLLIDSHKVNTVAVVHV